MRLEAPSTTAAPPASADREFLPGDIETPTKAIRVIPIRVEIEQAGGRTQIFLTPVEQPIHQGEGLEWDFRYFGAADVVIQNIVIEFDKPSPFTKTTFASPKPGGARPHRQVSGPLRAELAPGRRDYEIRAFDLVRRQVASAKGTLVVE
ncbi:MAG: hypothetical protein WBX15_07595 [Thermoanaerobaculia bacterium]